MCGNVGIINRETSKQEKDKLVKYFKQALFSDTLRGHHGTGIMAVTKHGDAVSYKKAMKAPDFLDLKSTDKVLGLDSIFLSGHNRWATQGDHTDENSHPFKHEHITMFHNGTLDTVNNLPEGNNFEVDSEAIAYSLSKKGAHETLESIQGAFALVWYDSERQSINFARNKERPLFFGFLDNNKGSMLYASEKEMMSWLATRNKLSVNIKELEHDKHLEIFLDDEKKSIVKSFKSKESWYNYNNYSSYSYYQSDNVVDISIKDSIILVHIDKFIHYKSQKKLSTFGVLEGTTWVDGKEVGVKIGGIAAADSANFINKDVKTKVVWYDDIIHGDKANLVTITQKDTDDKRDADIVGPGLSLITKKQFDEITKHGCSECSCDLEVVDDYKIVYDHFNNPYCSDCGEDLYL